MSFSIATTINQLLAPRHELSCSWLLWRRLIKALRQRGVAETRESGAFLLGTAASGRAARITDFVLYDDLDPHCLASGIVEFDGRYFGKLWRICRDRGLTVVADVHVHPGTAEQSASDQAHPMISQPGHLALILPRFARQPMPRVEIGIFRYHGKASWQRIPAEQRASFFLVGL